MQPVLVDRSQLVEQHLVQEFDDFLIALHGGFSRVDVMNYARIMPRCNKPDQGKFSFIFRSF